MVLLLLPHFIPRAPQKWVLHKGIQTFHFLMAIPKGRQVLFSQGVQMLNWRNKGTCIIKTTLI